MAGDLIPPPSPAGKPTPEGSPGGAPEEPREAEAASTAAGGGLWSAMEPDEVTVAAHPDEEPEAADRDPLVAAGPVPERFRARFGFVTGALVGIGVAALAISALLLLGGGGGSSREVAWSEGKPTSDDPYVAAEEIAQHVGRQYRIGDGTQLVAVHSSPPALRDVPLRVVVKTAAVGGDFVPIYGKGIQYTLNGLGEGGSIAAGTPSTERLALLKRQALELALYTFRYIPEIDHVVTLLPPRAPSATATPAASASPTAAPTATPSAAPAPSGTVAAGSVPSLFGATEDDKLRALLFRPGDLEHQLEVPLELTLGPTTPRPENFPPRAARTISEFTLNNIFVASVTQAQDNAFLVLERPSDLARDLYAPPKATPTPKPPGKKRG